MKLLFTGHPERWVVFCLVTRSFAALRMIRLGVTAFLLFLAATLVQALTIATYNVENYLVADRMVEGVFRPAYPKPEKEIRFGVDTTLPKDPRSGFRHTTDGDSAI